MKSFLSTVFSFNGRLNRQRFFGYGFACYVAFCIICLAFVVLAEKISDNFWIAILPIFLAWIVSMSSFIVRRLHDLGVTGWVYLGYWAIVIGLMIFAAYDAGPERSAIEASPFMEGAYMTKFAFTLWLLFARGTHGPNRFGEDRIFDDHQYREYREKYQNQLPPYKR